MWTKTKYSLTLDSREKERFRILVVRLRLVLNAGCGGGRWHADCGGGRWHAGCGGGRWHESIDDVSWIDFAGALTLGGFWGWNIWVLEKKTVLRYYNKWLNFKKINLSQILSIFVKIYLREYSRWSQFAKINDLFAKINLKIFFGISFSSFSP